MPPDPSTPPPPRLPTARLEALRAAASVHRGQKSGVEDVLYDAGLYAEWLEGK